DASAIVQKLDIMKVPYVVDSTGGQIRVPSSQVGKLRMILSADGLPKGGSVGYEIFDQKEGFGTTSFVQNINHLRALEGELARTIGSMDPIQSARVHLVLPQHELFSRNSQTATASIFIKTRGSAVLSREQVGAIQHLIAAAVPQLPPNQISIVDEQGNLLARPAESDGPGVSADSQEDMRASYESAQARKIEDLLSQTVGLGKVRAKVSADLDFDRITTSSEVYDPDSQVVRSTQSTSESSSNAEAGNQAVSVTNNLPLTPGAAPPAAPASAASNKSDKTEETINYEINKTVRNQVRESGQVKRLSIAVTVDGIYEAGAEGKSTYKPRSEEEMTKLKALAQSAVNFDTNRGDTIEIVNLPFAQPEAPKEGASSEANLIGGMPKSELFRMAETLVLALIGLLVVLLVVRPMLRKIMESAAGVVGDQQGLLGGAAFAGAGAGGGTMQLPPPSAMGGGGRDIEAEVAQKESEIERMIDISRVEGRVKASSLRKVGEIVDKHPDEAVGILRNWINQEGR
ncbi:MAG: flagellar basal-body MS-ring/collar protein FliF, partial [Bdellovibrionales bacterium]